VRPRDLVVALMAISIAVAGFGHAQDRVLPSGQAAGEDITVVIDTNYQRGRLRVAVPEPDLSLSVSEEARAAARLFAEVLREDLSSSGVFVVQGPEELAILELVDDPEADFPMYRSLGNEILVETAVGTDPARLVIEGRVFDLEGGQNVLGKMYRDPTGYSLARRIAHTFSDEIVNFITGRKGIARTAIAFHSDRQDPDTREIYLMDYDGFGQRAISAHQTLSMSPDWSPTGDVIAYMSYLGGGPGIYTVDVSDGSKEPVVTSGDMNISPAFSPDGERISFARSVGGGNTEIFVIGKDGSGLRRLTNHRGIDTNPEWSPTGREIAFTSNRSGSVQIYLVSAEGTDLRRITFEGRYNDGAAWSPDGTKIAYSSRRSDSKFDIAVTDLITLETLFLTEGVPGSHESPSYSPDGRKLAFASTLTSRTSTETQIYIMDLDGRNWRQVTREGSNFAPSWSGYLE
jgi:TolB protein